MRGKKKRKEKKNNEPMCENNIVPSLIQIQYLGYLPMIHTISSDEPPLNKFNKQTSIHQQIYYMGMNQKHRQPKTHKSKKKYHRSIKSIESRGSVENGRS